ncbi:MAG: WD40 repeat domain-containing serine/threonine protein kinase, partial [Planctomycetota bacterium]
MNWHPRPDELEAFANGEGTDEAFMQIEQHCHDCPDCLALLEGMFSSTPLHPQIGNSAQALVSSLMPARPISTAKTPSSHEDSTTPENSEPSNDRFPRKFGRYTLTGVIGEGGMGVVYRAQQSEPITRTVAIKVLKQAFVSVSDLRRFEFEGQTLADLNHPAIAQLLDAGIENGVPFFAMELIEGKFLTHYCNLHRLSIDERIRLFIQACEAIQYAHQKAVIHRDLKPSNILVLHSATGHQVKVIDFGIAKSLAEESQRTMTRHGQVLGTLQYMSPEQLSLDSKAVDTRSDVYSLGSIFYELLVGAPPLSFSKSTDIDSVYAEIRSGEPPRLSRAVPSPRELEEIAGLRRTNAARLTRKLSGELEWIAQKALEKDVRDRYQTVGELSNDLQGYLESRPLSIRSPSRFLTVKRFAWRHRTLLLFALLVGSISAGGIGSYLWQARRLFITNKKLDAAIAALQRRNEILAIRSYIGEMKSTVSHDASGNYERKVGLLNAQRPDEGHKDYRGWEWFNIWHESHPPTLSTSFRYGNLAINDLAFSPDGSYLAIAQSSSKCAAVLDMANREIIAELNCDHRGTAVAVFPDGRTLAVATNNGEIYLWDFKDQSTTVVKQLSSRMLRDVSIHPDGRHFAAVGDEGIFWLDRHDMSREPIRTESKTYLTACAYSEDGRYFATGDRTRHIGKEHYWAKVRVHDSLTNALLGETQVVSAGNHNTDVRSLQFLEDDKRVLVGLSNGLIAKWQIDQQGTSPLTISLPRARDFVFQSVAAQGVRSVKIDASNRFMAHGAGNNRVCFWHVDDKAPHSGEQRQRLIAKTLTHSAPVLATAFRPRLGGDDRVELVSADAEGKLCFWNLSPKRDRLHIHPVRPRCLALDQSGDVAAIGGESGEIACWDLENQRPIFRAPSGTERVVDIEFLPSSEPELLRLAIIDFSGTLQVFEFPRSGGALSAMEDAGESDLLFKIQRQFVRFFYDN